MDRPFFKVSINELEALLGKHKGERMILAQLREELQFRKTDRAKQLLKEVLALLDGTLPLPPKPPTPEDPNSQLDLIGDGNA
jgi:hypothetical protein